MTVRAVRDCLDAAETKLHDATDEILGMLEERCWAIVDCLDGLDDEVVSAVESAVDKSKVHMRSGIGLLIGDAERAVATEVQRIDAFLAGTPAASVRHCTDTGKRAIRDYLGDLLPGLGEEWVDFFVTSGMAANLGLVEPLSERDPKWVHQCGEWAHQHVDGLYMVGSLAFMAVAIGFTSPLAFAVALGALPFVAKAGGKSERLAQWAATPREPSWYGDLTRSVARTMAKPIGAPGESVPTVLLAEQLIRRYLKLFEKNASNVLDATHLLAELAVNPVHALIPFFRKVIAKVLDEVGEKATKRVVKAATDDHDAPGTTS